MTYEYKVYTTTLSVNINIPNFKLNLYNICNNLKIDEFIKGIKYEYSGHSIFKGQYSTTNYNKSKNKKIEKINKRLFRNQITLRVMSGESCVNAKLFLNGSLHLTGVKDIEKDCSFIVKELYARIISLSHTSIKILLTKDNNGIFLDSSDNVYFVDNENNAKMIGYKTQQCYYIFGKQYTINSERKLFINAYMHNKTQDILNFRGDRVGDLKIELIKNKKKIFKNKDNLVVDNTTGIIYYENDSKSVILGKMNYNYDVLQNDLLMQNSNQDDSIIELDYTCNSIYSDSVTLEDCVKNYNIDVNCINIYFSLGYSINRQKLYNFIIKSGYISEYNSEKYCGVKLMYKHNDQETGICVCNNKCTCVNVTFIIFQSGNVIASGFKNKTMIESITKSFYNIISNSSDEFKKKIICVNDKT